MRPKRSSRPIKVWIITGLIGDAMSAEDQLFVQRLARAQGDEHGIGYVAQIGVPLTIVMIVIGGVLLWMAYREWAQQIRSLDQMQAALAQSQKMETLGQLFGGIAHNFNNVIAIIKGGISLLKRRLPRSDPDVHRFMEGIELSADRAASLTQRLLAFARRQQIFDAERDIHLLFTDVGLPNDMTGRHLDEESCRRRPGRKVPFMTGYARNAIVHHGRLDPGVALIFKPFTQSDLAQKIRKILHIRAA